jgi:7-cyano-7-deazaguanine synthase in queuosine biosynthesis
MSTRPPPKIHSFTIEEASGSSSDRPSGSVPLVLGRDIIVDSSALQAYCFKPLSTALYDLILVAAAIAAADRRVRRSRSIGWARSLSLSVPVHEPDKWSDAAVIRHLNDVLRFLTGDRWSFVFRKRMNAAIEVGQRYLTDEGSRCEVVLPYSGGLDSLAQLCSYPATSRGALLLVTTWGRTLSSSTPKGFSHVENRHRLSLPVSLAAGKNPELTFRTRPFLYFSVAAVAALQSDVTDVVIPENGQGSLGPSFVVVGDEWPHRSTHPGHTSRLATLIRLLTGQAVTFRHPRLFMTKGQVLREVFANALPEVKASWSCARDVRRHKAAGERLHCGTCGGCILRRVSLLTAFDGQPIDDYYWDDLDGHSLVANARLRSAKQPSALDWDIAIHSLLSMQALASAARLSPQSDEVQSVIAGLKENAPNADSSIADAACRMLASHNAEWSTFLAARPSSSWVRRVIGCMK